MRLEDDAIVLRAFKEDDIPAITAACQDPEIPRWTRVPFPYTNEHARAFVLAAGKGSFAVVDRRTDEFPRLYRLPHGGRQRPGRLLGEE